MEGGEREREGWEGEKGDGERESRVPEVREAISVP